MRTENIPGKGKSQALRQASARAVWGAWRSQDGEVQSREQAIGSEVREGGEVPGGEHCLVCGLGACEVSSRGVTQADFHVSRRLLGTQVAAWKPGRRLQQELR